MIQYFIVLLILCFLFYRNYKRKENLIAPSTIVTGLFLISIILAYPYLFLFDQVDILKTANFGAAMVFIFLLFVFLFPFNNFNEARIKTIILPNQKMLFGFSIGVLILSFFSLIYFIPTTIKALTSPDIGAARTAMVGEGEHIVTSSVFNTIAGVSASFYQLPMLLFFIYQIAGINKKLKVLLFISSFSYVLFVFSYYGRDGVLFWLISFLGIMGFFRSFLSATFKKKLLKILVVYSVIGLTGFMIISFSRWGADTYNALLSYIGQPFPNFILAYNADVTISNGAGFPLFRNLLGLPEEVDTGMQSYQLEAAGTYSWVFGTFLKSFILNVGLWGTLAIGLIAGVILKISLRYKNHISFSGLLVYFLYFQILFQGVFYFRQYNRVGNLLIISQLLLAVVFFFVRNFGKKFLIEKIKLL